MRLSWPSYCKLWREDSLNFHWESHFVGLVGRSAGWPGLSGTKTILAQAETVIGAELGKNTM